MPQLYGNVIDYTFTIVHTVAVLYCSHYYYYHVGLFRTYLQSIIYHQLVILVKQ